MLKECKVIPYRQICICDECKKGEMLSTGDSMWNSNPPLFKHKCTKCGNEELYTEKYPAIKYRLVK